jgi:hypothetical protein
MNGWEQQCSELSSRVRTFLRGKNVQAASLDFEVLRLYVQARPVHSRSVKTFLVGRITTKAFRACSERSSRVRTFLRGKNVQTASCGVINFGVPRLYVQARLVHSRSAKNVLG